MKPKKSAKVFARLRRRIAQVAWWAALRTGINVHLCWEVQVDEAGLYHITPVNSYRSKRWLVSRLTTALINLGNRIDPDHEDMDHVLSPACWCSPEHRCSCPECNADDPDCYRCQGDGTISVVSTEWFPGDYVCHNGRVD